MRWLRSLLFGALMLGLLWAGWSFRSGNAGVIELDLIWIRLPNVELWWALVLAGAAGAGLTGTLVGIAWIRERIRNRRHRKAIERLESELALLRSLPAGADAGGPLEGRKAGGTWLPRFGAGRRQESS